MHLPNNIRLHAGSYKIIRFINSGGFGCTYEAVHTLLNRRVAIKEFFVRDICNRDKMSGCVSVGTHAKEKDFARLKEKFVDEARALYQMQHQGLVHVTDVFEENGTAYYVMDYIEGQSLAQIVEERGALPEAEALRYIREVCATLSYVHSRNRLHLDIKPGNIMVDSNGRAVLIDFGASKHYNEATGEQTSTLLGINTPGYAPIEQMSCNFRTFSPATDIYSLGATFYKLLTSLTPPNLSGEEELKPLPGTISAPVRKAVEASMQLKRTDRPQTIDEFLDILSSKNNLKRANDVTEVSEEQVETTYIELSDQASSGKSEENEIASLSASGYINGDGYVDLGLSVLWATSNVGADSPEDYGDYFAWGETEPGHNKFNDLTLKGLFLIMLLSLYLRIHKSNIGGSSKLDAARAQWGNGWRMPTKSEFEELMAHCMVKRSIYKGVIGYLLTSKKNGNNIFLPAAGFKDGTSRYCAGKDGSYWSSTSEDFLDDYACHLSFDCSRGDFHLVSWGGSCKYGQSVRPVRDRLVKNKFSLPLWGSLCAAVVTGILCIVLFGSKSPVLEQLSGLLTDSLVGTGVSEAAEVEQSQKPSLISSKVKDPVSVESSQEGNLVNLSVSGTANGHDYVDLGLSVLWAACNVGANSPEKYGDHFAWGEIEPKDEYTYENSKTYKKTMVDIGGNPKYDAARYNWGGNWRTPNSSEIEELEANCIEKWTTYKGVKGIILTSMKNGNSIFLPAVGTRNGVSLYYDGKKSVYLSSTPIEDYEKYVREKGTYMIRPIEDYKSILACGLFFDSRGFFGGALNRGNGYPVRPVRDR